jgi:hypothetical protein
MIREHRSSFCTTGKSVLSHQSFSEEALEKMKADDDIHLDRYRPAIFFPRFKSPGANRFQGFLIQPHSQ